MGHGKTLAIGHRPGFCCWLGRKSSSPSAADSSVNAATAARLIPAIQAEMRRGVMPGAIVAIQRDGLKPWVVARGYANLLPRSPMGTDMHFRIGSITKSFVTTVLMQLVQQRSTATSTSAPQKLTTHTNHPARSPT